MTKVSGTIRTIIHELNVSQTAFAKSVGISTRYLAMLLSGERSSMSRPLALLIEQYFGYSADWILNGNGEKRPSPLKTDSQRYSHIKKKIDLLTDGEIRLAKKYIDSLETLKQKEKEGHLLKKQRLSNSH